MQLQNSQPVSLKIRKNLSLQAGIIWTSYINRSIYVDSANTDQARPRRQSEIQFITNGQKKMKK